MSKSKKQQNKEEATLPLSEQLYRLQMPKNNGRGVCCVRDVCMYLTSGDRQKAMAVVRNEWDKISSYPDIANWLKRHELAEPNAYVTQ